MPPKKDAKKQAVARPDNSGIPKQDVQFKFNFEIKTDAAEFTYAIMFEWFGVTSDKLERMETTIIDTWQKVQGGFTFQKACDAIRVDDDFCKTLSNRKFYIYFVNGEDNKVEDSLYIDYSSILMAKGEQVEPSFTFSSSTIRVMGIDEFKFKLTANKELLQETYRHYLNPLQIEVIGAKDVPLDNQSKYQPAFVRYTFFDGSMGETTPVVGGGKLIWNHKHVCLTGLMDPALLKEKLRSSYLKFELHDRDEIQNKKIKEDIPLFDLTKAIEIEMENQKPVEEDPKKKGSKKEPEKKQAKKQAKKDTKKKDVKLGEPILPQKVETFQNNYGIAAFYLVDFLKPTMRTAKYKAPVVPKTTFEDFQSRNIDLNTTARNEMQKIISSNNYFEQDTVMLVGFTLAYAIGTFVKPPASTEPVAEDPKKGKKQAKQAQPQIQQKQSAVKEVKDIFERVVYVIPYKSLEYIEKIENIFYEANMRAFALKNRRQITTYLLKQEEKTSLSLDYLSGIELIDNEARIYIIEGLREGSMKKLHEVMIKTAHNTKSFKILKNSNITFLKRLYSDFNIQIKRVRFRPSLTQLLLQPSIYIKSKVPEEISLNLNKINEIKKICDDLKSVDSMSLWPDASVLIQIERKFSDSLSFEDINGYEQAQRKKKPAQTLNETSNNLKTINFMTDQNLKYVTMDQFSLPKIAPAQPDLTQSMPNVNTFTKKNVLTKTFMKDESKFTKSYDMRLQKAEISPNEPVYIYAGQKNNWYEKQMRDMREKIQKDKNAIYTYSHDYLGLSIDPRSIEQQQKNELLLSATKNISSQPFSSLIVRTKEERMKLPKKPNEQDIEDLKNHPYHEQKSREKQLKKNTRDLPVNSDKPEFAKYIKKPQFFSVPEVSSAEKITPHERFLMEQEQKKKLEEEHKRKLLGDPNIKIKRGYGSDKVTGLDRFTDIREGSPVKKGIIDVHKKSKSKRPIENYEVSFMLKEDKNDPSFNPLVRRDNPSLNVHVDQFNNYQRPQILTFTEVEKPLKNTMKL